MRFAGVGQSPSTRSEKRNHDTDAERIATRVRIRLVEDQGNGPEVVYVPGIDGTGQLLLGTQYRIERRFRLLRLRYVADDPVHDDTYERLAAGIVDVLDPRNVANAILIAESFGGAVALQCALDFPQRVRALLIVNSFVWFPKRASLAMSRVTAPLVPRWLFALLRPRIAAATFFGKLREPEALARFRAIQGAYFDRGYRRRIAMIGKLDLRSRLGELRQPLAIFAAERDRVVPAAVCGATMHELAPHAELHTIANGGHVILPLQSIDWPQHIAELNARADS